MNPVMDALDELTPGMVIYTCLIAPFMEEFIFRGVLLKKARRFGDRTAVVFCAVMFVVFMVYSILTGASLFYSMIFNAAGAALILAPFYVYMCMKVGKHGPALVYNIMWAIIAGLMMGPFMIPWFLGGGIIAELSMCGKDAYHDIKRVSISWVITALVRAAHGMSEIWFFRDAFLATGVSEQQVQVQTQYYTDPKYVLLSLAVTAILAVLGCMISNKLIVKHFRKSGAIK